jgi:hypothetical protein
MTIATTTGPGVARAFIPDSLPSAVRVLPELVRRLDQLGNVEMLRWLVSPVPLPRQRAGS